MALSLTPLVFAPGELAPLGFLYIIHRGIALYGGRVLIHGKVWGYDMILRNPQLRRFCARAMTYLEVWRRLRAVTCDNEVYCMHARRACHFLSHRTRLLLAVAHLPRHSTPAGLLHGA